MANPMEKYLAEAKFVGLDARTGKTVWEYSDTIETAQTLIAGGGLYVTPQVAEFAGETCAIMPALTRTLALRIADGKKVWEYPCSKRNWTFSPQAVSYTHLTLPTKA